MAIYAEYTYIIVIMVWVTPSTGHLVELVDLLEESIAVIYIGHALDTPYALKKLYFSQAVRIASIELRPLTGTVSIRVLAPSLLVLKCTR